MSLELLQSIETYKFKNSRAAISLESTNEVTAEYKCGA